jgi:hypothetical protein
MRTILPFLLLAACAAPNDAGSPDAAIATSEGPGASCAPPLADASSLPSCCTVGEAHCVPSAQVPGVLQKAFADCSGGYCVPDPLIASGGARPPSCKSIGGADGVCMSLCVPQVAANMDLLPVDTCAMSERCAPCISPLDNMPTGACDIGSQLTCGDGGTGDAAMAPTCPHQGPPVLDPSTLPSCSDAGGAHCVAKALVPPAMMSQLATCATGYCVPDVFIEAGGQYVPRSCDSLDGAEGRCLHVAVPQVALQKDFLPVDSCKPYERCAPCYSPVDGSDTNVCHIACDPGPHTPKVTFGSCCTLDGVSGTQGKCVPSSAIPATEQMSLAVKECTTGQELCVPTENLTLPFIPKTCTAFNLLEGGPYTGVCLSNCFDFGLKSIGISQGDCDDQHACAPCVSGGMKTGAPGCPP